MLCSVKNCGKHAVARGWCSKHYTRWTKYGDPLKALRPKKEPGERVIDNDGYVRLRGNKHEHIEVAERALGHPLPQKAQVHHVNENRQDNRGTNLVICPDAAYHKLLHRRAAAFDACGHATWMRCSYCKGWDDPANMYVWKYLAFHRECRNSYRSQRNTSI